MAFKLCGPAGVIVLLIVSLFASSIGCASSSEDDHASEAIQPLPPASVTIYEVPTLAISVDNEGIPDDWRALNGPVTCRVAPGRFGDVAVAMTGGAEPAPDALIRIGQLEGPEGAVLVVPPDRIRTVVCAQVSKGDVLMAKRVEGESMRVMVPYALFYDANEIHFDPETGRTRTNWTNFSDDRPPLKPRDVPADQMRQWYITIPVPADIRPGTYRGTISFESCGQTVATAELVVEALDIELLPPAKLYGMYEHLEFSPLDARIRLMLQDLAEAGFHNSWVQTPAELEDPATGQKQFNAKGIEIAMRLREEAGLKSDFVIWHPLGAYLKEDPAGRAPLVAEFWAEHDWPELVTYGEDEASGEKLRQAAQWYKIVREAGIGVATACAEGYEQFAGDVVNFPILMGSLHPTAGEKLTALYVRERGATLLTYGYPQMTQSDPLLYRQRTGFNLWNNIYDGWQPFTYGWMLDQHKKGSILYPGVAYGLWRAHGVVLVGKYTMIPRVEWPAMRQGVDDVRYATTLAAQVLTAEDLGLSDPAIDEAAEMLQTLADRIETAEQLEQTREDVIDAILRLQNLDERLHSRNLGNGDIKALARRVNAWILPDLSPRPFPMGMARVAENLMAMRGDADPVKAVMMGYEALDLIDEALADGRIHDVEWKLARDKVGEVLLPMEAKALDPAGKAFGANFDVVAEWAEDWVYITDPEDHGLADQWYLPDADRAGWATIEVTKEWDVPNPVKWQGHEGRRLSMMGLGWYVLRTEVPAGWKGEDLYLWLNPDEDAMVFVNGELVRQRDEGDVVLRADTPTLAPLSEYLRPGEVNTIAIRVFNLQGPGGLKGGIRVVKPK